MAGKNRRALTFLLDSGDHPEWVATVAFYTALQIVEAAIVAVEGQSSSGHKERHEMLKRERKYKSIWEHYRPLFTASLVARYLNASDNSSGYRSFEDFMRPEAVKSELVNHRLHKVKQSVEKLLKKKDHKSALENC